MPSDLPVIEGITGVPPIFSKRNNFATRGKTTIRKQSKDLPINSRQFQIEDDSDGEPLKVNSRPITSVFEAEITWRSKPTRNVGPAN